MRQIKSVKRNPKYSKDGHKYIVFDDLPNDQKRAWRKMGGVDTCRLFDGEKYTPYYHDYEAFYKWWTKGTRTLWD